MERSLSADIEININKSSKNIVKIIPFYDRDKGIAKKIETILCRELECITDEEFCKYDTVTWKIKA